MIIELERFIKTVDKGSFTKASKSFFLTQPALSLSIERLEQEVGCKLFKRIGKRLVLTKDGETIYQIGKQILKLWSKIKDIKKRNIDNSSYSIGLYDNAALRLSKYFQKNLAKRTFSVEITIDKSSVLIQGMHNGLFDICICVIEKNPEIERNAILMKKFSEALVPVSSKIWKNRLSEIPFILYNKDSATREYLNEAFIKHNIQPNVIVESTNTSFMKELAIGGCGIALLPVNVVKRELDNKKLFVNKFPFKFQREIGLYLSRDGRIKEKDDVVKEIIENLE